MSFDSTLETLRTLHSKLCAALRRGEMLWYGQASDYQSKYAFSADYDSAFKRNYNERASTCLEMAQWLETLPLPTAPEEVAAFVDSLKQAIARCPQPPGMQGQLESLAGRIEAFAEENA
jgi:hypothetical protein